MGWPVEGKHVKWLEQCMENGLSHAYLFVGKNQAETLEVARYWLRKIFCEAPPAQAPCDQCVSCRKLRSFNHPDVQEIAPDGQAIKIGQIRELQRSFSLRAVEAERKAYVIHDAGTMTAEAANALLRFLEEPAFPCIAILLVEEIQQLLPTIISRCQIIHIEPSDPSTERIAEVSSSVVQWMNKMKHQHMHAIAVAADLAEQCSNGQEQAQEFLEALCRWYRDVLFVQYDIQTGLYFQDQLDALQEHSRSMTDEKILSCIDLILAARKQLRANANLQLVLEALVLRLQEVWGYVFSRRHSL